MAAPAPKFRPDVSMPGLLSTVRAAFESVPDSRRQASIKHSMDDALMAGLAMFSLKYPSLLMFDEDARANGEVENPMTRHNLMSLFSLTSVPSDTQMRTILDPVEPKHLRPAFRAIHSGLQRSNALREMTTLDGRLLLSIDGTGTYSSSRCSCTHCCEKPLKGGKAGEKEYYHQMMVAAIVHPDKGKPALPLDFEPITKRDGATKNDCERRAGTRLIPSLAAQYPKRRFCVLADALGANGPHLKLLTEHNMDYLIVAKPGCNAALFEAIGTHPGVDEWIFDQGPGIGIQGYRIAHGVPLNDSHKDLLVNTIEYREVDAKGREHYWCWVTNLVPTRDNAEEMMRAARARWRIENELFNSLKNQGYHFEHSYGHGEQYLASVLGGLCLLAFLIDQVEEGFCRVFAEVRERCRSRTRMWERLRASFTSVYAPDWGAFFAFWANPGSAGFQLPGSTSP